MMKNSFVAEVTFKSYGISGQIFGLAQSFPYENYCECYKKLASRSWPVLFTLTVDPCFNELFLMKFCSV